MAPPDGACGGFCCVAKRFDRPFRLPRDAARRDADAAAGVAEGGVASSAGSPSGRPPSEPDADAGGLAVAASTSRARASEGESPGAEGPPDDSDEDETPEEEATARARLAEILRAIDDEGDAGGGASSSSGALAHGSPSARAHLSPLAHLSHRRERHCRVILQHPAASRVARLLAAVLEDDAPENADDRALAALLAHNLSLAAARREPREEEERNDYSTYEQSDEEEEAAEGVRDDAEFDEVDAAGGSDATREGRDGNLPAAKKTKPSEYDVPGEEGAAAPMLSLVNHDTWEGILRSLFAMVTDAIDEHFAESADAEDGGGGGGGGGGGDDDETTTSSIASAASASSHAALCRGALGTATGAMLAAMEPDSARAKILAMDGGRFVDRVFREVTRILPARHGDAALDAVGIVHRLLWIRPDASAAEKRLLSKSIVAMGQRDGRSRKRSRGGERVGEGGERVKTDSLPDSRDPPSDSDSESDADPYDPDELWDWRETTGYSRNPHPGAPLDPGAFHRPFREAPDPARVRDEWRRDAEAADTNGFIAALRTHLPEPGAAGSGRGAGGGTVACTQAVHVLRALFEDLKVLDLPHKFPRGARRERKQPRASEGGSERRSERRLWRQLRTAQLRDLALQLAVVVETLGLAPPRGEGDAPREEEEADGGEDRREGPDASGEEEAEASDASERRKKEAKKQSRTTSDLEYGGAWRGWTTSIPREGSCDGAVGAAVGVLNAVVQHPQLSSVLEEHPRFGDVMTAVTRAMSSRCSCAWATFSVVVNLAGKGGSVAARLMSTPAAGHLLRALSAAVRDRFPIATPLEMPPPTFLPKPDEEEGEEEEGGGGREDRGPDGSDRDFPAARSRRRRKDSWTKKKKKKASRRDAWREKTVRDLARERRAEAKKAREKAKAAETRAAESTDASGVRVGRRVSGEGRRARADDPGEMEIFADDGTGREPSRTDADDPTECPSNRLLLRTTAAAALASAAREQRRWDDYDAAAFARRAKLAGGGAECYTSLDAIDAEPASAFDAARSALALDGWPLVSEALELWYAARGGRGRRAREGGGGGGARGRPAGVRRAGPTLGRGRRPHALRRRASLRVGVRRLQVVDRALARRVIS